MALVSHWPDWKDAGKRVRIDCDGKVIEGVLYVDDFFFDGEDEVPMFRVRLDDGSSVSFADNVGWSFL